MENPIIEIRENLENEVEYWERQKKDIDEKLEKIKRKLEAIKGVLKITN